mgnify:FL=1
MDDTETLVRHKHKYYYATIKKEFEPRPADNVPGDDLYELVEYAYAVCNCGAARKTEVKLQNPYEIE